MILAEVKCLKNKKIWKISWVKEPANDRNWIAMRKEHPLKLSINEERHEVTGIVLVPDQRVYRGKDYFNKTVGINEDGEFFMSADTIKEFAIEYMRMGNDGSVDHSQDENDNINDCVTMIESWLITTPNDKAYDLGYSKEDAPIGTWLKTDKVDVSTEKGLQLWKDIKNGVYRGFSVEGNPEVEVIKSGLAMQTNESDYLNNSDYKEFETIQPYILAHLKNVGQTLEQLQADGYEMVTDDVKMAIESDPNEASKQDNSKRLVRYYYKGVRDDKNRKFCADVLDLNLWYRKEDIDMMSFREENPDFGVYSIFKYEGSYGCRHTWDKNYFSPSMKFSKEKEIEDKILNAFDEVLKEYKNNN